jgi:hypothetical protein
LTCQTAVSGNNLPVPKNLPIYSQGWTIGSAPGRAKHHAGSEAETDGHAGTPREAETVVLDYFRPLSDPIDNECLRIKGNFRRRFVSLEARDNGLDSIPKAWLAHDLSEALSGFLQVQDPRARGGEDLPDLAPGEVEIARLSLLDSVHGEVTSLRALQGGDGTIQLTLVDEYESWFELPCESFNRSLTAEEVVAAFRDADPSPVETECTFRLSSYFYPTLNDIARDLGLGAAASGDCR